MKPYPFSDFISSLYGFIYSTATPNVVGVCKKYDSNRGVDISDVSSSISVGDSSYWDPALKDEITASWLASDIPKYFSLFSRSNEWDYHQFLKHVKASDYSRPESHVGRLTYETTLAPMIPGSREALTGVMIDGGSTEVVSVVGPGGRVVVKCPISKDRVSYTPRLTEYMWDPDTDHLDIYLASVTQAVYGGELMVPILSHESSLQDEYEVKALLGIYFAKLIRGEHSPDVFRVYGGAANSGERRWAVRQFVSEYLEASAGRFRRKRDRAKSGCAFAYSATLHMYTCDHFHHEFSKVNSIEL
jgi:hypothetical protein